MPYAPIVVPNPFQVNLPRADAIMANYNQRTHTRITSPGKWRPLNGLLEVIGMDFYPTKPHHQPRNGTQTGDDPIRSAQLGRTFATAILRSAADGGPAPIRQPHCGARPALPVEPQCQSNELIR